MSKFAPKETISVLIGNNEEILSEIIFDLLQETLGDNLSIIVETESSKITQISQKIHFDLFVLVLNNIFVPPPDNQSGEKRVGKILDLMSELKQRNNKPVIAMAGWPNDPGFASKATEAGADYFFKMPFKHIQFQEAVMNCLISRKE